MGGKVYIGVGGWTFAPWRDTFYPKSITQKKELGYMASQMTSVEVNGTFYRSQSPETFAKWAAETPDDFVFALKGPRYATNRRVLAEAGESVSRFIESGISELGAKLGPINWQLAGTKTFDAEDFAAFVALLPDRAAGRKLRHAIEVRHESFAHPEAIAIMREAGVTPVVAGDSKYPLIPDITADFVYLRLMGTQPDEALGYSEAALGQWRERLDAYRAGRVPDDLAAVGPAAAPGAREVFCYVIAGAKEKNPLAANSLISHGV